MDDIANIPLSNYSDRCCQDKIGYQLRICVTQKQSWMPINDSWHDFKENLCVILNLEAARNRFIPKVLRKELAPPWIFNDMNE